MGTQGVVSFTKDGKTVIKVITGLDGQNAGDFIQGMITQYPQLSKLDQTSRLGTIYNIALRSGFGGVISLVVMDKDGTVHNCKPLSDSYRETFDDPTWNPRWRHGTADYVKVVEISNGDIVHISQ